MYVSIGLLGLNFDREERKEKKIKIGKKDWVICIYYFVLGLVLIMDFVSYLFYLRVGMDKRLFYLF